MAESSSPVLSHRDGVAARALLSAAVFGTLGALLGKKLGRPANEDANRMVESVMKWSMGGFWATLAAYSSIKASECESGRGAPCPTTQGPAGQIAEPYPDSALQAASPDATVYAHALERHGAVHDAQALQGMKK